MTIWMRVSLMRIGIGMIFFNRRYKMDKIAGIILILVALILAILAAIIITLMEGQ